MVKRQSKLSANSKLEAHTLSNDFKLEKDKILSPDLEIVMAKAEDNDDTNIEIKQRIFWKPHKF